MSILRQAINESFNESSLKIATYAGLSIYFAENIKDPQLRYFYLISSVVGFEILFNYIDLTNRNKPHKNQPDMTYEHYNPSSKYYY